eukprot:TRINITY_DN11402_c0_g2_i1.p1 TRINITY_DN11402_c0_g2~~TRINITY_DN11402_c0_g2_i1.p1  ORF type:complete len:144 (-),score=5.67 TRINITY_DN11402_c0_g2_i1:368-799(-)
MSGKLTLQDFIPFINEIRCFFFFFISFFFIFPPYSQTPNVRRGKVLSHLLSLLPSYCPKGNSSNNNNKTKKIRAGERTNPVQPQQLVPIKISLHATCNRNWYAAHNLEKGRREKRSPPTSSFYYFEYTLITILKTLSQKQGRI